MRIVTETTEAPRKRNLIQYNAAKWHDVWKWNWKQQKKQKKKEYEAKFFFNFYKWTVTAGLEATTAKWTETSMKTAPPAS